jgi:hypothetical protein
VTGGRSDAAFRSEGSPRGHLTVPRFKTATYTSEFEGACGGAKDTQNTVCELVRELAYSTS